ncbi:hypothetical protein V8G54_020790 [Vigna mungo]|uniref:Uncharacterized protein n=1 Tax=Vigna mungo TaxID=3915 RepID=A0AAQ3RWR8_VIGMU
MNSSVGRTPSMRLSRRRILSSLVCVIIALHSLSCLYCSTRRLSCSISELCLAQNSSSAISLLIDSAKTFSTALSTCFFGLSTDPGHSNGTNCRFELLSVSLASSCALLLQLLQVNKTEFSPTLSSREVCRPTSTLSTGKTNLDSLGRKENLFADCLKAELRW